VAGESFLNNGYALLINTVNMEYRFSQINTNCSHLHPNRLSQFVGTHISHFGTWMPVGEGATIAAA
jgi:hypothetical protein